VLTHCIPLCLERPLPMGRGNRCSTGAATSVGTTAVAQC
jgi:hypothetical protein